MLLGILRFEWRYHTRQHTFAAAALGLSLLALTLVGTGYGPDGVHLNSPYTVMQSVGLMSLLGVFVLTIFCANAALRDVEHGMTELVFSRPVGKPRYLLGRFAGALLAGTTAMAVATLVLMLAPLALHVDADRLGPVRPLSYAWAMLVMGVPNLLLAAALLFSVATLTRSTLATYVGGVAIYAGYVVCAMMVDSPLMAGAAPPTPEGLARAAMLDPFGLSAFFEQTRYWTTPERDLRLLSLSGHVLANRALWMAVAAGVLALTYWRFTFHLTRPARRRRGVPTKDGRVDADRPAAAYRPVAQTADGIGGWLPAFGGAVRMELRHVLRGWTFLAMLALWGFVAAVEAVSQLGGGEYGTRVLPTTGLMLNAVQLPLLLLGTVAVVYYGAEIAWRERVVGFDALADATPAHTAVFYLAKAVALALLPALMAMVAVVIGVVVQLANGQAAVQPALYLGLLWYGAVPLALFAVAVLAVQALSPNRWIGMIVGLALAVLVRQGGALGLEHPMLRFGAMPAVAHSDMDGFGAAAGSFAAFAAYWLTVAALLACVTWGVWRRGLDAGVTARIASLPARWGPGGRRTALVCAWVVLAAGGALLWQTNVAHAWESGADRQAWRAGYERAYRRLASRAQPSVVAVRTSVDLYPEQRRARIDASYVLENRTPQPIDTVWVMLGRDGADASVEMPGARLVDADRRFGMFAFRPERPIAPGGRAALRFRYALDRGGIRAGGFEADVAANGTLLMSARSFPSLGYRAGYELSEPAARRRQGLSAPPTELPGLDRADSVRAAAAADAWITLDATVSTAPDQTVLAPGELVRTWTAGGRRWFHYVTERPVTPLFGFASARYAVRRERRGQTTVEVWYHPAHAANVDRIVEAATRALAVLGPRYGAYPHPTLRIAEVPAGSDFGGFALPGLVLFTEDRGFLADPRSEDVDLITRRVAHEVAHQWWGHALYPAQMAGATTLTETLAKHSEQLVVASMHGPRALAPMLAVDEDRYLAGRAREPRAEPTLLAAEGEPYLYYGKGAVVMNGLRDLLGEAAVDRALRSMLAQHGGPRGDATSPDLLQALRAEARTPEARTLVDQWLTDRVVYDLLVNSATSTRLPTGAYRVSADITARKSATRGTADVALPMDGDPIDVAVFDSDPSTGHVLYLGKQRVVNGHISLSVDVSAAPGYVVVDPFVRRIDRDRTDDAKRLAMQP